MKKNSKNKKKKGKGKKLNAGYYHELIDRIHVINCNIDNHLIDHAVLSSKKYKHLKKKAEEAQGILMDIYQEIGEKL